MVSITQADFRNLSTAQQDRLLSNHLIVGYEPESRDMLLVPEVDRYSGGYVIGKSGSGKSSLLESWIHDDAAKGNAVFVIDPHGDLTKKCLAHMPALCIPKTSVLDLQAEDWPFSINLFAHSEFRSSAELSAAVNRIVHVFNVMWPETEHQAHLPLHLQAATIALLHQPGATLVDMQRFLDPKDSSYRSLVLRNPGIDQWVLDHWLEYDGLTETQRRTRVQPLLNRLGQLFMGNPLVRNVVGQRKATVHFRRAIENREIIFIRLPVNDMEKEAHLVGMLAIAQISAAIFSFSNLPEDQRPGVTFVIDEFQTVTSKDFERLYTQARKYKVRLVLAHQYRGQMPDYLQSATMQARTIVAFQSDPDDARKLATLFPIPATGVNPDDLPDEPVKYLLKRTPNDPHVETFVDWYLRPAHIFKKHGMVVIEGLHRDFKWHKLLWKDGRLSHGLRDALEPELMTAPDPAIELDRLFRKCMTTGNWHQLIPVDAVTGLSNAGHNFFDKIRKERNDLILEPGWLMPPELVVQTGAGYRWIGGVPRNALQQYMHCVFCLRMTMKYLAEHPLGKTSEPTNAAIAAELISLPRRTALVRIGDQVSRMVTYNTPGPRTGYELRELTEVIQSFSRERYCRPKFEVEAEIRQALNGQAYSVRAPEPVAAATSGQPVIPDGVPMFAYRTEVDEP